MSDFPNASTYSDIYSDAYTSRLEEIESRLEFLEAKTDSIPGICAESVLRCLQDFCFTVPPAMGVPVDEYGVPLRDQYGTNAKAIVQSGMSEVFKSLCDHVEASVSSSFNFNELNLLRARVRELEEDLGYRRKVAEKLMEEPKGNRR
jgi:hypothetical protein